MNIFWITANHPPDTGGMAASSARIVEGLRARGHMLRVLHLPRDGGAPDPAAGGLVERAGPHQLAEPERLFWEQRSAMSGSILVGFGGTLAGYLAVLWSRWLGAKSLVLYRGNDFDRMIHDLRRAWMTHFIVQNADLVGAVSREMADRIRSIRPGPVLFTPNSIDTAGWALVGGDLRRARELRQELRSATGAERIVSIFGELKAKKGLDLALSLFTTYGFRDRAALCTVGSLPESMAERLSASLGASWVQVPFRKRDDLPPYYRASDIVFIPSLYDGMPNVLLEAMALGRVVVASDAGAMPDVIVPDVSGFLFPAGDVSGAAAALDRALSLDEGTACAVGESARRAVEKDFSPRREVDTIIDGIERYIMMN